MSIQESIADAIEKIRLARRVVEEAELGVVSAKKDLRDVIMSVAGDIRNEGKTDQFIAWIYWSCPEVDVLTLANAFGMTVHVVVSIAATANTTPLMGVVCGTCGGPLIPGSRAELHDWTRPKRRFQPICHGCNNRRSAAV